MSSVVSAIIGGNASQNVAESQADALIRANAMSSDVQRYGIDINRDIATQALSEQYGEFQQNRADVQKSKDIASQQLADAASNMQEATAAAPAELLQEKMNIENKSSRTMQDIAKQTGANLATSGVRGGQAAILKNRATGEAGIRAQESIDELLAQDAAARRAAKTGFYTTIGATSAGRT